MFKSIQYKLIAWLAVFAASCAGCAWYAARGSWAEVAAALIAALVSVDRLSRNYKRFNSNILFLLNALDNGDYSFHFSTTKLSRREKELNLMLNRIKEILANARAKVMENERFLSIIVESVATGIAIVEPNDSIRTANRAAVDLLGLPTFTHLKQLSALDPSYFSLFSGMTPGKAVQLKIANEREELLISVSLTRVTIGERNLRIFSLTNIGNELEAREMESWIKLIRVMTHEIMNSIAPITSLSESLLEAYGDKANTGRELYDNTIEAFATINTAAKGLLSFVDSYRKFTGIPKPVPKPVEIGPLVSRTAGLENASLKERGIKMEIQLPDPAATVAVDETLIRQVLVNVLKNAAEAVVGQPDPQVIIRQVEGKEGMIIEILNNGRPIPEEVLPHIFVPFFTTKDTGTGIGLSLSRYIMRLHGGNLKYRRSDGWTVFSMTLPLNYNH